MLTATSAHRWTFDPRHPLRSYPCRQAGHPGRSLFKRHSCCGPHLVAVPQTVRLPPARNSRTTRSSAAAPGRSQQALPAAKAVRVSSKARVSKPPLSAMVSAPLAVAHAAPSPRTSSCPTQRHPGYCAVMVNQSSSRAPRAKSCIQRMPEFSSFGPEIDSDGGGDTTLKTVRALPPLTLTARTASSRFRWARRKLPNQ